MKHLRLFLLPVILCACVAAAGNIPSASSQSRVSTNLDTSRFQQVLDDIASTYGIRGISAAVVVPGRGDLELTMGFSEPMVPVRPDMLLNIGSETKSFTSAVVLQLVHEGRISLDDPIGPILGPHTHISPSITIRQLLNMTSGLFEYDQSPLFVPKFLEDLNRIWTPEELLQTFMDEPHFVPGGGWRYSNTNYVLLAMVIEKITDTSYATHVRNRLLGPLGLTHTYVPMQDSLPMTSIVHPWNNDHDNYYLIGNAAHSLGLGTSGMYSTAGDMVAWARNLFGGGVLDSESMAEMKNFIPGVGWSGEGITMLGYGLGVYWDSIGGRCFWATKGEDIGFTGGTAYDPLTGTSVAILSSTTYNGQWLPPLWGGITRLLREALRQVPATTSPSSLVFGDIPGGKSRIESVMVHNPKIDTLHILSLSSDDPSHFTISASGTVIPPLGDVTLYITFQPDSYGDYNAHVTIHHDGVEATTGLDVSGGCGPLVSLQGGWNLISLPLKAKNSDVGANFPTASSHAFEYAGRYKECDALKVGKGYWLKMGLPNEFILKGSIAQQETVDVSNGWNIIGSLSTPIPASSIISDPPGMVTSAFWLYQGGHYVISDTVQPGIGYWSKANGNGKLILSAGGALAKMSPTQRIKIVATSELPPPLPDGEIPNPKTQIPNQFVVAQNFPNPFNPMTTIKFDVPVLGFVTLKVYDVLGQEVATLVDGVVEPGFKAVTWDASGASSGIYFYRLEAVSLLDPTKTFSTAKKLVLLK